MTLCRSCWTRRWSKKRIVATAAMRAARYYRLTSLGERVVAGEIQRLESVFRKVKVHLQALKPRRA